MATRKELEAGVSGTGEMNAKRFSEHIQVAHGTVKRWIHEGMPCRREGVDRRLWIDPEQAQAWLEERFKGRKTIAFARKGFVYVAQREDGRIKVGWSSDVMRRITEMRRDAKQTVQLLACFPGNKPAELRLHDRLKAHKYRGEWYEPHAEVMAVIDSLSEVAA